MNTSATSRVSSRQPIPILTYHQIAPPAPRGTPYRSLCVSPEDFARQMAFLRLLGYQGLSMTALLPYLSGEKQGKVVGITLDDGYTNNLENALPVLQRNGFSATCYVVSQMLGRTNEWDHAVGIPSAALMTAGQLRQWTDAGQEVGAHTRHHVHLPQLASAAAVLEIAQSRTELEQLLGQPVHHFCYPYGEYGSEHVAWVQSAGYLSATTTSRGRCQTHDSLLELPRVPVPRTVTRIALWMKLATAYEDRHAT